MRRCLGYGVALGVLLLANSSASAAFVASVTGDATLVAPPLDATPDAFEVDEFTVWEESTGSIVSDLDLEYDGTPGDYKGNSDFSLLGTTLSAGTAYSSTLIHLDPVSQGFGSAKAVVTFTSEIIGMAIRGVSLDASDIYGAPGTTYPTGTIPAVGLDTRGIDFRGNDKFEVSLDRTVLTLHFTGNGTGFDQIRVFTAASEVPEPVSLAIWSLMATAAGGGSWWRKRKAAR